MAYFGGAIYSEAIFKKTGAQGLATHPIGTGPYKFVSFSPTTVVLIKNPTYFFANQFPMQRVEFRVIPDDNSRLLQVQSGDIDIDSSVASSLVSALKTSQDAHPLLGPSTIIKYLQPNHHVKPWDDVKVRQAVNHAIDRDLINKKVFLGLATLANSFMAKGAIDWNPNVPVPTHDLALAKKLLQESSVPHGFTMKFQIHAGNQEDIQTAVLFQQQVAPLGIKVTIIPVDPTTLATDVENGKFDFVSKYWTNDIPDPDELVSYTVDPTSSNCYYTYCVDPAMATLSRQAERITDQAKRAQLYYKIQEIFANEVPFFSTVYPLLINGVNNHVKGFSQNPLGYFVLSGVTKS